MSGKYLSESFSRNLPLIVSYSYFVGGYDCVALYQRVNPSIYIYIWNDARARSRENGNETMKEGTGGGGGESEIEQTTIYYIKQISV